MLLSASFCNSRLLEGQVDKLRPFKIDLSNTGWEHLNPFEYDLLTIQGSPYYKQLRNKLQLVSENGKTPFTNRLSHTHEVVQLSTNLAIHLGLASDQYAMSLVGTLATIHDVGHVPFSHIGEYVFTETLVAHKHIGIASFNHDINSVTKMLGFSILTGNRITKGFPLTCAVIRNILLRDRLYTPHRYKQDKDIPSVIKTIENLLSNSFEESTSISTISSCLDIYSYPDLEGQIVVRADEIAFFRSDLIDACISNYCDFSHLTNNVKLIGNISQVSELCSLERKRPSTNLLYFVTQLLQEKLCIDLCKTSFENYKNLSSKIALLGGSRYLSQPIIIYSQELQKDIDEYHQYRKEYLYPALRYQDELLQEILKSTICYIQTMLQAGELQIETLDLKQDEPDYVKALEYINYFLTDKDVIEIAKKNVPLIVDEYCSLHKQV